jgi:ABC-type antimicrobial peptide transport system ATPase subunit
MTLAIFEHLRVHLCFSLLAAPIRNSELTKKVRALVNPPALLAAYEPIGNLDTATAETLFVLLLDVVRSTGTTVPVAAHHP